jgi:tetratricopeptide (TPR) repeat protein
MAKGRPIPGRRRGPSGKSRKEDEEIINIVEVKDQAQDFFERYSKVISGVFIGLVVVIGAYFFYKYLYMEPREVAAQEAIFTAEQQFTRDSFALALENPGGGFDGFLDIIDNYNGTKTANLAKLYSGISYMNLGRYDDAIRYLNSYSAKGSLATATKNGTLGDAYAEKGDLEKALSYYNKAAAANSNEFMNLQNLKKAALLNYKLGNNDAALKIFKNIMDKYPDASEAHEAEKFIIKLGGK